VSGKIAGEPATTAVVATTQGSAIVSQVAAGAGTTAVTGVVKAPDPSANAVGVIQTTQRAVSSQVAAGAGTTAVTGAEPGVLAEAALIIIIMEATVGAGAEATAGADVVGFQQEMANGPAVVNQGMKVIMLLLILLWNQKNLHQMLILLRNQKNFLHQKKWSLHEGSRSKIERRGETSYSKTNKNKINEQGKVRLYHSRNYTNSNIVWSALKEVKP